MTNGQRSHLLVMLLTAVTAYLPAQTPQQEKLPDTPGRDVTQKICGSCHATSILLGRGMTRDEWSQVVLTMISRGAKGTQGEFATVVDYLATNFPPTVAPGANPASPRRRGGAGSSIGPANKQLVDPEAAARGQKLYAAQCASCHGPDARGGTNGPDLIRSATLLHDHYTSTLGPFLSKGHPALNGVASARLTSSQILDISHFLHQQVDDTLRSGPYSKVLNVLTGNAKAGEAYFNGAGECSRCHSPAGDLAHLAAKYDPPTLQQRFLFPRTIGFGRRGVSSSKPVLVTVKPPDGPAVSGVLDKIDDFNVSLRDSSGEYHSWKRSPDLHVEKNDPYAAHGELLDKYTDQDIHNVVAYLETLK